MVKLMRQKQWYKDHWCDLTPQEHRIFELYEQKKEADAKAGRIRVMYELVGDYENATWKRIFEWWNGTKWVFLK